MNSCWDTYKPYTHDIKRQIIMPYDEQETSGCQLSKEPFSILDLYTEIQCMSCVCTCTSHVQVCTCLISSNILRKLTPWSFLFIIGHNNLPLDVMCIWCVCAAVRLSAVWCRIAIFAAYMTMFNTGTYKVHTKYEQSIEWMFCIIWRHTKYILVLLVIAMFIMCMYQHKT